MLKLLRQSTTVKLLVGLVAVLLVAEGVIRTPALSHLAPEPGLFYTDGVQLRIDLLEAAGASGRSPDLLFIGNSVAATNINPRVVSAGLAGAGHDVDSFVLGLPGLTIDPLRVQLERLWLDKTNPTVIVQVVRMFDFVSPVTAGEAQDFAAGRVESRWVNDSLRSRIELALFENSALVRHAGALSEMLTSESEEVRSTVVSFPLDEFGHQPRFGLLEENLREYGIEATQGGTTARDGYRTSIELETYSDGLEMLRATAELVQSKGARYVLLNMPEHPAKFLAAPDGEVRYASYLTALEEMAAEAGMTFVDLSAGDLSRWSDDEFFFDFHHLNADGAAEMSNAIAEALGRRLTAADFKAP